MENNIKTCPDKICRTCLRESAQMRSLSDKIDGENRTVMEALGFVTNINVLLENRLPSRLCGECESILYKADAFKRRCLESEMILGQTLEMYAQTDIVEEITKISEIKDEKNVQKEETCLQTPFEPSDDTTRPSNSAVNDIFASLTEVDGETKIFADITISKHSKARSKAKNNVTVDTESVEVKNEFDDEMSFDFDNCETFETVPIEFKEEKVPKESKKLTCSCGVVCDSKNQYRLHIFATNCSGLNTKVKTKTKRENKISVKKIVCPICNENFNSVKACKIHQRKHKDEDTAPDAGNYECTMCFRKFSRKSSHTNHIKNHVKRADVNFTCITCKREFKHKAHLDNHILSVHTREKGYSCDVCMKKFTTEASLEIHRESHKIEKKHICQICKKAFYMLSTLNDHMRVHTGEKPYLCSICGKGFSQKTNLAQHVRRHQGLKPFKCEECERRFVSKGELTAHSRSHSGAHPFVCEECGGGFTTSSSLVKHRRTHTGERPYACDLCPMRFAASGTLKNHRRTHTGEKPYQCSYCEKAFVQRHDLIAHIRGHTGERPFTCHCSHSFRKASALKAHMRLHEKEPQRDIALLEPPTSMFV